MPVDWSDLARRMRRDIKFPEAFVQPNMRGKEVCLEYRNLVLHNDDLSSEIRTVLRRSGVPTSLISTEYKNWGGRKPKLLYVWGKIVVSSKDKSLKRFVATDVTGEDGIRFHNQITALNLLYARGFYTPLARCSWVAVKGLKGEALKACFKEKCGLRLTNISGKKFSASPSVDVHIYNPMAWRWK